MILVLGMVFGLVFLASLTGVRRFARSDPQPSDRVRAVQAALHAATATLPYLEHGLTADSAPQVAGHLRDLTQAPALALTDGERLLAFCGPGADHHRPGDPATTLAAGPVTCRHPDCPLRSAVLAPIVARRRHVGDIVALFTDPTPPGAPEVSVVGDAAILLSAQASLAEPIPDEGVAPIGDDVIALDNLHGGVRLVRRGSILYLQAHGDYARVVVTGGGRYLVRMPMAELQRRWEHHGFVRVHRGYLVNLRRAVEIRPRANSTALVLMTDGSEVPVARRHIAELRRRLVN